MGGWGGVGVAGRFWGGGGGLAQKEKSPDFRCPEVGISALMSVHLAPSSYLTCNTYFIYLAFIYIYIFCYRTFVLTLNVFH